jgi:2-keto-4-pentenoate hydratase
MIHSLTARHRKTVEREPVPERWQLRSPMNELTEHEREAAADLLATAEAQREPIEPLTTAWPNITVVDAYEIQLLQVRNKLAAGASIRGHKVGLSARAMQEMMGVHEPDYGHLLDTMFVFEGDAVEASQLCYPRVEVEVAFVLGAPLQGPGVSVADVLRATAFVLPSIEIIDSRIIDWKIKLPDTIADNASSARLVLGGVATTVPMLDLRTLGAVVRKNGEIVATGASGAVLGNPATAVAWLANKVHSFGVTLDAGHVILPGSCTRAIDVKAGDSIRADFDVIGSVNVNFA